MKSKLSLLASGVMMSLMAGGALAAADYCGSDGTYTSVYVLQNSTQTVVLNTSDVSLNEKNSDDCYGVVLGNDREDLGNLTLWDDSVLSIGGWKYFLKDATKTTNSLFIPYEIDPSLGETFDFTLDADVNSLAGDWVLTVTPKEDLPIQLDFIVVLKATTGWAAYLFDDELISNDVNNGEFIMKIKNNGGNVAELSHMSIYVRDYFIPDDGEEPPVLVPEPGILFLMGAGLLGLGLARRRKSA